MDNKFYVHDILDELIKLHDFCNWSTQDNELLSTISKCLKSKGIQIEDEELEDVYFKMLMTYTREGILQLKGTTKNFIKNCGNMTTTIKLLNKLKNDYLALDYSYTKLGKMQNEKVKELLDIIYEERKRLYDEEDMIIRNGNVNFFVKYFIGIGLTSTFGIVGITKDIFVGGVFSLYLNLFLFFIIRWIYKKYQLSLILIKQN